MADDPTITVASLCAGVGMLDIGVETAFRSFGIRARTLVYCERDAYAAACLLARMAEQALEPAAVCDDLGDLTRETLGAVDCVAAGFPCQPWSTAGKQAGTDDERWLWPEIARIIRETSAWLVVLENVPGLRSGCGLNLVLHDLAQMGFAAEGGHLTAEAVGASHKRERLFLLAWRDGRPWRRLRRHIRRQLADAPRVDGGKRVGLRQSATATGGTLPRSEGSGGPLGNPAGDDERRAPLPGIDRAGEPAGGSGRDVGDAQRERRQAGLDAADARPDRTGSPDLVA